MSMDDVCIILGMDRIELWKKDQQIRQVGVQAQTLLQAAHETKAEEVEAAVTKRTDDLGKDRDKMSANIAKLQARVKELQDAATEKDAVLAPLTKAVAQAETHAEAAAQDVLAAQTKLRAADEQIADLKTGREQLVRERDAALDRAETAEAELARRDKISTSRRRPKKS